MIFIKQQQELCPRAHHDYGSPILSLLQRSYLARLNNTKHVAAHLKVLFKYNYNIISHECYEHQIYYILLKTKACHSSLQVSFRTCFLAQHCRKKSLLTFNNGTNQYKIKGWMWVQTHVGSSREKYVSLVNTEFQK